MRAAVLALGACLLSMPGCVEDPRGPPTAASGSPWKTFDAAFRAREGRAPEARGRGFVLDDSYKDPAIVEGLLRA
jgi:hypothetical protein